MATRRSRIKAVANLPARRSRPLASNEVKKEGLENSDGDDVPTASPNTEVESCIKALEPVVSKRHGSLCQKTNVSDKSVGPLDRESVIVSVDKDRKCVIVNRDDCISSAESKLTLEDGTSEENIANDQTLLSSRDASGGVLLQCSEKHPSSKESKLCQPKGSLQNLKKNKALICQENVPQDQPELLPGYSNEIQLERKLQVCQTENSDNQQGRETVQDPVPLNVESSSPVRKRTPLRSRRSKPTVNLTAATRKRATIDSVVSSPCSPPPKKIKNFETRKHKSSESENNNESTSTSTMLDEKVCSNKSTSGELANLPSTHSFSPLSPEAVGRLPPDVKSLFKTPVSSLSRTKDPHHAAPSESSTKVDGSPISPLKESSTVKRKQSTNAQRVAAARKSLKSRLSSDGAPPRSRLTMFDLIFYNPCKNPMISSDTSPKKPRPRMDSVSSVSSIHEDRLIEESVDDLESERSLEENAEEPAMPVPQVKVGPDGSLILDEQSLVIETTGSKKSREELEKSGVIIDTKSSYGHYKKVIRSKDWSDHETKKFYRALNVVGTDFSLMKPYFRKRSRRELKLKFKKEEKLNPSLVNKALAEPLDFDISELEKECELEDEEEKRIGELEKEKASEKSKEKSNEIQEKINKKPPKKKAIKQSRLMAEMDFESDTPRKKLVTKEASKKVMRVVDANAEADYSLLAMGVDMPQENGTENSTEEVPSLASCSAADFNILVDLPEEPVKKVQNQKMLIKQKELADIEAAGCSKNSQHVKHAKKKASKSLSAPKPKNSPVAFGISPLVNKNLCVVPSIQSASAASSSICKPVISYNVSSMSHCKLSSNSPQSSNSQTSQSVIISAPVASPTTSGARQITATPRTQIQVVQRSPLSSSINLPLVISSGMTPRTLQIVKRQPLPSQPALVSISSSETSSAPNNKQIPSSRSQIASSFVSASSSLVSTPSPKLVSSSPLTSISTVQFTPQSMSGLPGSGLSTPVSRLLPSTPPLPRMEPGSIIVLKTPLPQNPDRHILQVYMVTSTPQGSSQSPVSLSPGLLPPGMNLLTGPTVQPAPASNKSPCISDDSDCEKVLTKL